MLSPASVLNCWSYAFIVLDRFMQSILDPYDHRESVFLSRSSRMATCTCNIVVIKKQCFIFYRRLSLDVFL